MSCYSLPVVTVVTIPTPGHALLQLCSQQRANMSMHWKPQEQVQQLQLDECNHTNHVTSTNSKARLSKELPSIIQAATHAISYAMP